MNSAPPDVDRLWNRARIAAIAVYLLSALGLGLQSPGMHYDEAIYFNSAVHLLTSRQPPPFAIQPWSWITVADRQWPIMVLPYAGPLRSYLALGPFAMFGANNWSARMVTVFMGALGIWGFSVLIRDQLNPAAGALTAALLAVNPAYLSSTIYDLGAVTEWMAPFGLASVALASYLRRKTAYAAFWLGLAIGTAVWTRANLVWLFAAIALSGILVLGKQMFLPLREILALCAGGLLGLAPLLWYEIRSGGGTFAFMQFTRNEKPLSFLLQKRAGMFAQMLLSDSEHRVAWNGPEMPLWQMILFPTLVGIGLWVCLRHDSPKQHIKRMLGLTFVLLATYMFCSRFNIAEHHLIALLPLSVLMVALAAQDSLQRWRIARYPVAIVLVVYLLCATQWNMAAAHRFRSGGGAEAWSDAIHSVSDYLGRNCVGRKIKVLDWGLHNSLFVLSNGKITPSELFWGATVERSGSGKKWTEEIVPGDVYVLHAPELMVFWEATEGFGRALAKSGHSYRSTLFSQKSACPFAEVVEILADAN